MSAPPAHLRFSFVCVRRIGVTAFLGDREDTADVFQFRTNAEPHGGSCTVSPQNGTAIHTEFHIGCSGWKDEQMPLTYEFRYRSRTGMVVIEKGYASDSRTTLPVGDPDNNFVIKIEIQVIDNQGAAGMTLVKVHVGSPHCHSMSLAFHYSRLQYACAYG